MAIWLSLISLISLISLLSLLSLCAVLIEMGKTGIFHRMNHERVQKIDWCKKKQTVDKMNQCTVPRDRGPKPFGRVAGRFVGRFFDEFSVLGDFLVGF